MPKKSKRDTMQDALREATEGHHTIRALAEDLVAALRRTAERIDARRGRPRRRTGNYVNG